MDVREGECDPEEIQGGARTLGRGLPPRVPACQDARVGAWGSAQPCSPCLPTALTLPFALGPPTLTVQAKCDPCLSSPCQNQGTCRNDPLVGYRCACPSGYKVRGG